MAARRGLSPSPSQELHLGLMYRLQGSNHLCHLSLLSYGIRTELDPTWSNWDTNWLHMDCRHLRWQLYTHNTTMSAPIYRIVFIKCLSLEVLTALYLLPWAFQSREQYYLLFSWVVSVIWHPESVFQLTDLSTHFYKAKLAQVHCSESTESLVE